MHEGEEDHARPEWWTGDVDRKESIRMTEDRDTRCYFNVRSKADMSQLNLPHGTDN